MNNQAFSKIWIISIIVTIFILVLAGFLIYWMITNMIKTETSCFPPYGVNCETALDCFDQTKCQAGQGIICFPQCALDGYSLECLKGKCIWTSRKNPSPL